MNLASKFKNFILILGQEDDKAMIEKSLIEFTPHIAAAQFLVEEDGEEFIAIIFKDDSMVIILKDGIAALDPSEEKYMKAFVRCAKLAAKTPKEEKTLTHKAATLALILKLKEEMKDERP